jgi:hypothetical protein
MNEFSTGELNELELDNVSGGGRAVVAAAITAIAAVAAGTASLVKSVVEWIDHHD